MTELQRQYVHEIAQEMQEIWPEGADYLLSASTDIVRIQHKRQNENYRLFVILRGDTKDHIRKTMKGLLRDMQQEACKKKTLK